VYRLLGLCDRYGPGAVEAACAEALSFDVVQIGKIASMVQKAAAGAAGRLPSGGAAGGRFARPASQFAGPVQLSLIRGGLHPEVNGEMLP
jgi:hypothetical protein